MKWIGIALFFTAGLGYGHFGLTDWTLIQFLLFVLFLGGCAIVVIDDIDNSF